MNNTKPYKRVTLKDIAAKTGYSVTAVSHALKDMPDISQEAKNYIPFVLIGRHFENHQTNSVVPDDFKSGYLLGKHL